MSGAAPPGGAGTGPAGGIPAPGLTAAAPAPAPSAVSTSLQSYADLYSDTSRFLPWDDDYNDAVGIVTIPPAGAPTSGSEVRRRIRNTEDSLPQTWMALFADPTDPSDMGSIKILHRHSYFAGPMSRPADPNVHDMMYAFMDDFQAGQQIYTVLIPDAYFNTTPQTQVPDWTTLNQAVNTNALPVGYGPYAANDAGTDVIRCRVTCWIAPTYAALILRLPDTSPQNVLRILGHRIVSDGKATECITTINWRRMALT